MMKASDLPPSLQPYIRNALARNKEVWLIGSRANGNATPTSDWDLLVFGDASLLSQMAMLPPPDNADLLIVHDGENFESPWPRPSDGLTNSGNLERWRWKRTSLTTAVYEGTKDPHDWGSPRLAERIQP